MIHFVTDRYPEVSIKNAERQHRAASGSQKIHISKPDQPIPKQWKKYLAHGYNKENLVDFFFETWKKADVAALKGVIVFGEWRTMSFNNPTKHLYVHFMGRKTAAKSMKPATYCFLRLIGKKILCHLIKISVCVCMRACGRAGGRAGVRACV